MNVLIVFDHPRRDSFCGAVLDAFEVGLKQSGHSVETADLWSERFDPRLGVADEPEWGNYAKRYSAEVLAEQARIERHDALAFVFPVWWWSFPAMTKGWIDRVWNYGWAYGNRTLSHRKAVLLAVNAGDEAAFAKRGYDAAIRTQLVTGILNYCGIADTSLELLYGALDSAEVRQSLLDRARLLGRDF